MRFFKAATGNSLDNVQFSPTHVSSECLSSCDSDSVSKELIFDPLDYIFYNETSHSTNPVGCSEKSVIPVVDFNLWTIITFFFHYWNSTRVPSIWRTLISEEVAKSTTTMVRSIWTLFRDFFSFFRMFVIHVKWLWVRFSSLDSGFADLLSLNWFNCSNSWRRFPQTALLLHEHTKKYLDSISSKNIKPQQPVHGLMVICKCENLLSIVEGNGRVNRVEITSRRINTCSNSNRNQIPKKEELQLFTFRV